MKDPQELSIDEIMALPPAQNQYADKSCDRVAVIITDRAHEDTGFPVCMVVGFCDGAWAMISDGCDLLIFDGKDIKVEFMPGNKGLRCWKSEGDVIASGVLSTIWLR